MRNIYGWIAVGLLFAMAAAADDDFSYIEIQNGVIVNQYTAVGDGRYVKLTRSITASAPLSGSDTLDSDITLGITNNNGDAVALVDTNTSLTGNSDTRLASQKAVKTYADTKAVATRNINTTAPVSGGGDLSADRTIILANEHGTTITAIETNTSLTSNSDAEIPTVKAVKTYADTKAVSSRSIATSAPLAGGGDLTGDRTLSLTNAHGVAVSLIDTNTSLTADSDARLLTQKAAKTYTDTATALWDTRDKVEAVWAGTTTIWCDDNDGAASGLDADLLDTYSSAAFGRLAADQSWTGTNTFGEIRAGIQTGTYAVSATNTAAQMRGAIIYVTGAATITLPAVADGDSVTIITIGAVAVSVDPDDADKIYLDGVALDDGDKITNLSAAGDLVVITYYSADGWYAASNGWTDGG